MLRRRNCGSEPKPGPVVQALTAPDRTGIRYPLPDSRAPPARAALLPLPAGFQARSGAPASRLSATTSSKVAARVIAIRWM